MSEVPLYDEGFACETSIASRSCISERRENTFNVSNDSGLAAKAEIWP